MNFIKKSTIVAGTVVGGVVGGTIQLIGKMSGAKFLDSLGESIVDSTIYTGTIAGEIISGGVEIATGKISKNDELKEHGKSDIKSGGGKIVGNFVGNIKMVATSSGDIVSSAVKGDRKKAVRSAKRLAKVIAVGAITVGAIKIADEKDDKDAPLDKNQEK